MNSPLTVNRIWSNAVLTAVGHDLRLILNWLRLILRKFVTAVCYTLLAKSVHRTAC